MWEASTVRIWSPSSEIVVIDASSGRLDHIRRAHEPAVRWLDFERPAGVRVSIPHQRNAGVRAAEGDIIVFTDAGCRPFPGWLDRLVTPLRAGETVTAGVLIPERAFQHWTGDGWSTEPGSFVLSAGPSSASLPLTATIELG